MALSIQTFSTLVSTAATIIQGASQTILDMTVGSVNRAILEGYSAAALWCQYLILEVSTLTRLATSTGPNVDTYIADFGLTRLPGTSATGLVTLSTFTPTTSAAAVPVGATVRTQSSVTYTVYEDTTNPAYNAQQNAYIRPLGTASVTVPVECTVAGVVGNVSPGVINVLGTAIPGIDTVNNQNAFTDGSNGETDAAARTRFASFFASLSEGTVGAIKAAIGKVQTALLFQVNENQDAAGNTLLGNFVVYVDDGSGNPPTSLITAVQAAVDVVRPIDSSFQVLKPTVISANVVMSLTLKSGANVTLDQSAVVNAITAYFASLSVGQTASYTQIAITTAAVDPAYYQSSSYTLNGGQADIQAPSGSVVRAGMITVTAATV